MPLVWMPWPLSIRIFMVLLGTALRFRVRCPVGPGMTGMADQVGHDGSKVIKKYEFQLQAAGTRFSLIYSAAGRYGASQIHSYFLCFASSKA